MLADYTTSDILFAFALTLLAGLATGVGGFIAIAKRNPGPQFFAAAMGLSAGVMLYVSFVELLPQGIDSLNEHWSEKAANWGAVGAFFLGIILIAVIDRLVPEPMNPHEPEANSESQMKKRQSVMMKMGVLTASAIAIHNFPEGFATFVAGLSDSSIAIPVALAIAIHNIPEGIAVGVPIREATGSRKKAFWWATLSGLAEPLGALIGALFLMSIMGPLAMGFIFASIAGVMVFVSLDELLPAAIATGKHHTAIYGLIIGMGVMALSLILFI